MDLWIYLRIAVMRVRSAASYRSAFVLDMLVQVITYSVNYFGIWVILKGFGNLNGWAFYEIMVLYNFNLLSYGICGLIFWSPMQGMEGHVQSGSLDTILTKPLDPFWNNISNQVNHCFFGHMALCTVIFFVAFRHLSIPWTAYRVGLFALLLVGAVLVQAGVMVAVGSLAFYVGRSNAMLNTTIYSIRRFVEFPISIYGVVIQILLTFVIPYAFVSYFPAKVLFGKTEQTGTFFPGGLGFLTPLVGAVLYGAAHRFWRMGLNRYQGAGS